MKSFQEQSPLEWKRKQKRPVYLPCTVFTLEKQPCGEPMEFDLYEESDLPFLDPSTEIGREVSKKIVQSSLDDDVMSDDDTITCATSILQKELSKAIGSYTNAFNKGALVRNLE